RDGIQNLFYEDILEGALPRGPGRRHARHLAALSLPRQRRHAELRRRPLRKLHARDTTRFANYAALARSRRRGNLRGPQSSAVGQTLQAAPARLRSEILRSIDGYQPV